MPTWVLDATTKKIEASMSGAPATTNPTFMSSYSDQTITSFTPGSNNGSLNGVTAVTLVAAPAASTQRIIKDITIYNKDTAVVTITLRIDVSATDFELFVFTLVAGGTWSLASLREARGTTPVNEGGTGAVTLADGGLVIGNATGVVEVVAAGLTTQILVGGGPLTAPVWGTDIPTAVTVGGKYIYRADGTDVPLADGGTNASLTAALGAVPYSTATALALLAPGTAGQLFRSGGAGAPTWTTSTWPTASPAAGTYLRGDGTNWITSTLILPNAATAYRLPVATSANTVGELAASGATGEYLAGMTGAIPVWATLTQNAVVNLTTTSSPTLAGLTLGTGPLIQALDAAHYFGGVTTAGSWRIVRESNDLVFERYESAAWVTKFRITAVIP